MSNVVNLAAYRSRRALQDVIDRYTEEELDGFWDESLLIERARRGVEPSWVMIDEIHHWTNNNTAFEQLRRDYLNHIADRQGVVEWTDATPERRRESERALRILRGTDHGSDDGYTDGHRADPGLPRS